LERTLDDRKRVLAPQQPDTLISPVCGRQNWWHFGDRRISLPRSDRAILDDLKTVPDDCQTFACRPKSPI